MKIRLKGSPAERAAQVECLSRLLEVVPIPGDPDHVEVRL